MSTYVLVLEKRLRLIFGGSGVLGIHLQVGRETVARCALPIAVQLFSDASFTWFRAGYQQLQPVKNGLVARGEISAASSRILVADRFILRDDHVRVARKVRVEGDSPGCGFLTAFEWDLIGATIDDPWLVPGVWYGRNLHVPPYAIGAPDSRMTQTYCMFREDRLPLPFALHFDEKRRIAFSVAHLSAGAETVEADDNDPALIDSRLGFGSMGMYDGCRTAAFWYPGTEGETSYPPMWTLGRGNDQSDSPVNPFSEKNAAASSRTWSYRYHPLRDACRQEYLLRLDCTRARHFAAACDEAWRRISSEYRPRVMRADLDRIERVSSRLLAEMTVRNREATGIPTWVDCFGGGTGRLQNTFGIGFVARNLEAGFLLLTYGLRENNPSYRTLGREILDFWTTRSGMGLSHTDYDPSSRSWIDAGGGDGDTFVFLRDQSDSHRACLQAWSMEREQGIEHPEWLAWAKSLGDWLAARQHPDGSFFRAYRLDGATADGATSDCAHVIPFLLALDRAIGTNDYGHIAVKTAEYLWTRFHKNRDFVGGTLDNPNCTDKEGSALAFEAYLSLFEATGARKWLAAAETAARVCETWIFQWNIPMPVDDPQRFFPGGRTTVGFQLITTGFSAFDMYLTRHVGEYARLARYCGDRHYRKIAEILLHNTKSTVQLGNEYGYASPGMQIEHWSMGRGRGYGINSGWLPWVTTSHLISINAARKDLFSNG